MKTHSTQFRVEEEHLDKGDHANWLIQLKIAQDIHHMFRDELGLGLKLLKDKHKLFLVMGEVTSARYRKQLRSGDIVNTQTTMWIASRTTLQFRCLFYKDDKVATEMSWVMPLVSMETERLCKIPSWISDIIGIDQPTLPASTST